MLAQVKKLLGDDFGGRFGAWWDGRDYAPPVEAEAGGLADVQVAAPTPAPVASAAPVDAEEVLFDEPGGPRLVGLTKRLTSGGSPRLAALETLWGDGRFTPGCREIDSTILDEALHAAPATGVLGFIGVDGALLRAAALRNDRPVQGSEWRPGCVERLRQLAPNAQIAQSEVDRPRGFQDGSLDALVSVEAFAYADHKAGLVSRAARALAEGGRWVFIDTTRHSNRTPRAAFASAWAEPQLSTVEEIEELLALSGFEAVRRISATELVLAAARDGFAALPGVLEAASAGVLGGRGGAEFLQELAWEAESWQVRRKALEGGALQIDIWVADKKVRKAEPPPEELTEAFESMMAPEEPQGAESSSS